MAAEVTARQRRALQIAYWVAVVLLSVGAIAVSIVWSSTLSSAREYDQAPTCLFGLCDSSDIRQVTATVLEAGHTGGKSTVYWLELRGLGPAPQRVDLADGGGVWPAVHAGDKVTVALWRGLVTVVANGQASSQAWDNPDFTVYNELLGLILIATPCLALIVGPAVNRSACMRRTGWFFSAWIVFAGVVYFAALLVVRQAVFFLYPVSVAVAGMLLYPATVLINRSRRARRTSASSIDRRLAVRQPPCGPSPDRPGGPE